MRRGAADSVGGAEIGRRVDRGCKAHLAPPGDRPDAEIAETFFNSVARRVHGTVGCRP